jgi:hypothetical protein
MHDGDLEEEIQEIRDPLIREFLDNVPIDLIVNEQKSDQWLARIQNRLKEPDLVKDESVQEIYIPTQTYAFLKNLHQNFPRHELLLADFDYLPEAIDGINGPAVIQIFVQNRDFNILCRLGRLKKRIYSRKNDRLSFLYGSYRSSRYLFPYKLSTSQVHVHVYWSIKR